MRYTSAHALCLYGWRRRARAPVNVRASLSMRRGRRRRDGCTRWAIPSASLAFALSIALTVARCAHEWMEARSLCSELIRWLHDIVNILTRLIPIAGGATY